MRRPRRARAHIGLNIAEGLLASRADPHWASDVARITNVSLKLLAMTEQLQQNLASVLVLSLLIQPGQALAQRAEPPLPDRAGNFNSSQTTGNRGLYEVRHWLVVEADRNGTNCRDPRHGMRPLTKLFYGDLLETDTPVQGGLQQAVESHDGMFWLRIRLPNWRIAARRGPGWSTCVIRANSRFIAPVNGSDLVELTNNIHR